ncbi:MAG: tRNA pseudouridine(55) synthase TruB [Candidatus Paceibacterota bacterium]
MEGIILIDKPSGITSFDVIRRLRTKFGAKKGEPKWKMGHAGTLDPMASGLMIIAYGPATKRLNEFLKLPKVYEAGILLGVKTDTGDLQGKILETVSAQVTAEALKVALKELIGTHEFAVPAYSAIKQGGEALYKKARRGEKIELPKKPMTVKKIILKSFLQDGQYQIIKADFEVGSGTYIRTLAEEIGYKLGLPATLQALRRTQIGDFSIGQAEKLN